MVEQPVLVETLVLVEAPSVLPVPASKFPTTLAGILQLSPDSRWLALAEPAGQAIRLLSADGAFQRVEASFLLPQQRRSRNSDRIQWLVWNAESTKLAIGVGSGSLFILDCACKVQRQWSSSEPWGRAGVAAICFGPGDQLIVAAHNAYLYCLSQSSGKRPQALSLEGRHIAPKVLAYHEPSGVLVVAGDGDAACQAGITISGWKLTGQGLQSVFPEERPRLRGRRTKYPGPSGWSIAFSPTGRHFTLAATPGRLVVFDLESKQEADTYNKFGGRKPPAFSRKLAYYGRDATKSIASACWWSPMHLALLHTDGTLYLAALPGFLNVLADTPQQMMPGGTAIVCITSGPQMGVMAVVPLPGPNGPCSGWRLAMLAKRTPEQLVHLLVQEAMMMEDADAAALQWVEAQALAQEFAIKLDTLYQEQWNRRPVDEDNIAANLARMEDRKWVIQECLRRVAADHKGQMELLQYGLNETTLALSHAVMSPLTSNPSSRGSPGASGLDLRRNSSLARNVVERMSKRRQWVDDEARWFACKRLSLLKHIDRLNTLYIISHRQYSMEAYTSFRDADLAHVAVTFAELGNTFAVQTLLQRHSCAVQPSLLPILSSLPETMDPREYAPILPQASGEPLCECAAPRPADWIECSEVMTALEADPAQATLLECTEEMVRLRHDNCLGLPTLAQVEAWYVERAMAIESLTGQLPHSVALLELAAQRGVAGAVRPALAAAQHLQAIHLSAAQLDRGAGSRLLDMGLAEFAALREQERLRLVLEEVEEEVLESDVARLVVPLLDLLPESSADRLRLEMIAAEINERPSWCERLVQTECVHLQIYPDPLNLAEAVLKGVDECGLADAWGVLESMLRDVDSVLAGEADGPDAEAAEVEQQKLRAKLLLVRAGSILHKYERPLSLPAMRACSRRDVALHLQGMLGVLAQRVEAQWGEKQWAALWREMRELQAGAWRRQLTDLVLITVFSMALMGAGRIPLATTYLKGAAGIPVDNKTIRLVSLMMGLRYLRAATSLDDTRLTSCLHCYQVAAPFCKHCHQQASLVQALLQLPAWGVVDVVPGGVRRGGSALPLLARVLAAQPDRAYKHLRDLLNIAEMLGMDRPQHGLQVRTLAAEAALAANDTTAAFKLADELMSARHRPAWKLCSELARHPKVASDAEGQRRLLGFASLHCPPDALLGLADELALCERRYSSLGASPASFRSGAVEDQLMWSMELPAAVPPSLFGGAALCPELAESGDAAIALQVLLGIHNPEEAMARLESVLGAANSPTTLRPLLVLGTYSFLVHAMLATKAGATASGGKLGVLLYLYTPLPELLQQAEAALHASHPAAANGDANGTTAAAAGSPWLAHARSLMTRLDAVRDSEELQGLNPEDYVDASKFALGDEEYQKEAILQVVRNAGSRAVMLDGEPGTALEAANQLLQKALKMAAKYHVAEWDVRFWFLNSVLVCATNITPQVTEIALGLGQELCSRAMDLLSVLYTDVFPLLPAASPPHLAIFIHLLLDCLGALPQEMQRRVAVTEPYLKQLEQVTAASEQKVPGIHIKQIITGALQFLLLPMLASKIPSEGPDMSEALSILYMYVTPANVQSVAMLLRALRISCVEAALKRRAKDMAKKKALLEQHAAKAALHESTAFLALASKMLNDAAAASAPHHATKKAAQAALACAEMADRMLPEHAAALATFATLAGAPQPLPEDVVGTLRAPAMRTSDKLGLLKAVEAVLTGEAAATAAGDVVASRQALRAERRRLQTLAVVQGLAGSLPADKVHLLEQRAEAGSGADGAAVLLTEIASLGCPLAPLFSAALALAEVAEPSVVATDLVVGAVHSAVSQQLAALEAWQPGTSQSAVQQALQTLERMMVGLAAAPQDPPTPTTEQLPQLTTRLRTDVWSSLEGCLPRLSSQARALLLELQETFANGSRWPGWQPAGEWQQQQHSRLLHARSTALIAQHFPELRPSPEELATPSTAQLLFAQLLGSASGPEQLHCLVQLLRDVWRDGAAWGQEAEAADDRPQGNGDADEQGGESPPVSAMHECWAPLLERMLAAGLSKDAVTIVAGYAWPGDATPAKSPVSCEEMGSLIETSQEAGQLLQAACLAISAQFPQHHGMAIEVLGRGDEPLQELGGELDLVLLAALVARGRLAELLVGRGTTPGATLAALLQRLAACPAHPALAAEGDVQGAAAGGLLPATVAALCSAGRFGNAAALVAERCGLHPALATCGGAMQLLHKFLAGTAQQRGTARVHQQPGAAAAVAAGLPAACSAALAALQALRR